MCYPSSSEDSDSVHCGDENKKEKYNGQFFVYLLLVPITCRHLMEFLVFSLWYVSFRSVKSYEFNRNKCNFSSSSYLR